eukprot:366027-Chlamydomonas_euryale.AAC.10
MVSATWTSILAQAATPPPPSAHAPTPTPNPPPSHSICVGDLLPRDRGWIAPAGRASSAGVVQPMPGPIAVTSATAEPITLPQAAATAPQCHNPPPRMQPRGDLRCSACGKRRRSRMQSGLRLREGDAAAGGAMKHEAWTALEEEKSEALLAASAAKVVHNCRVVHARTLVRCAARRPLLRATANQGVPEESGSALATARLPWERLRVRYSWERVGEAAVCRRALLHKRQLEASRARDAPVTPPFFVVWPARISNAAQSAAWGRRAQTARRRESPRPAVSSDAPAAQPAALLSLIRTAAVDPDSSLPGCGVASSCIRRHAGARDRVGGRSAGVGDGGAAGQAGVNERAGGGHYRDWDAGDVSGALGTRHAAGHATAWVQL